MLSILKLWDVTGSWWPTAALGGRGIRLCGDPLLVPVPLSGMPVGSLAPCRSRRLVLALRPCGMEEGGSGESHTRLWVDDGDALGRCLPC